MSKTSLSQLETVELRLRFGEDVVIHHVSTAPPRDATPDEIPMVDLSQIDGGIAERTKIADQVRFAAENLGFFYIKNHGINEEIIEKAHRQALRFFKQPPELKEPVNKRTFKYKYANNGWGPSATSIISPDEGGDVREGFGWSYSPRHDPLYKAQPLPATVLSERDHDEPQLWLGTSHLPGFKEDTLAYWAACLTLARKLNRIFALSLSLPEDYFDAITTFPGADGVYNYYPGTPPDGLGSHTDLQSFTLLWQDLSGGLQILSRESQWIWATPVPRTFVVNIGDFLARMTNDRCKSTVHRAYNRGMANKDRISMPFFFGPNYDAKCSVIPSCVDEEHPAKYDPITCGEWRELRFAKATK